MALALGFCVLSVSGCGLDGSQSAPASFPEQTVKKAEQIFSDLHRPVYELYELGGRRDNPSSLAVELHRHLAQSFNGEALTREYVEHFVALHHMAREGTSIQVLRVDYEEIDVLLWDEEAGQARVDVDWSVGGVVTHQKHRHPRTNRYRAIYELSLVEDGWRLTDTHLRDMQRIRGFAGLGDGSTDLDDLPRSGAGMMSPSELLKGGLGQDVQEFRRRRGESDEASPETQP